MVTPYELTATRKYTRKDKTVKLLLASLSLEEAADLLDVVEAGVLAVPALVSTDQSHEFECVRAERDGNTLALVFSMAISGEREVVQDGAKAAKPVVFTKGQSHVTVYYSVCLLWRPPDGTDGLLFVHSPWGRGGSKAQVVKILQQAVNAAGVKAKLKAEPMIPQKMLARLLSKANATKITYRKAAGVTSTFSGNKKSAPAEIDLVVKGSNTLSYRDELTRALRSAKNKDKFFTVEVRDPTAQGGVRTETFDDVEIDIATPGGSRRYSMKADTVPTVGFNLTSEINSVYYGLPDDDWAAWPDDLLAGVVKHLLRLVQDVNMDR